MYLIKIVSLMFLMAFVLACGAQERVGVRPKFTEARFQQLSVLPVYATSSFGLSANEAAHVTQLYEQALMDWALDSKLDVISSQTLQAVMSAPQRQNYHDGFPPSDSLDRAFEPQEEDYVSIEVQTIRALYKEGVIRTEAVLVGEVVYQTEGQCTEAATTHNARAWVDDSSGGDQCVVSHFQAKLIHAPSGDTIWHNRTLLERRTAISPAVRLRTIKEVVAMTLGGPGGLSEVISPAQHAQR